MKKEIFLGGTPADAYCKLVKCAAACNRPMFTRDTAGNHCASLIRTKQTLESVRKYMVISAAIDQELVQLLDVHAAHLLQTHQIAEKCCPA